MCGQWGHDCGSQVGVHRHEEESCFASLHVLVAPAQVPARPCLPVPLHATLMPTS